MPPGAFVSIVAAIVALALVGFLLTGLYRLKEGESIVLSKFGQYGKTIEGKGWHYALPILYSPWKKLRAGGETIDFVSSNQCQAKIEVRVVDASKYYESRYDIEDTLEAAMKAEGTEEKIKKDLPGYGLEVRGVTVIRP